MTTSIPSTPNRKADRSALAQVGAVSLVIIATIGVVGALYLGRGLFIPIALALFLNTLLRPFIRYLEKYHIPAPVSAALVVLVGQRLHHDAVMLAVAGENRFPQ
jgi:predicted PurR-regulated permease PerM